MIREILYNFYFWEFNNFPFTQCMTKHCIFPMDNISRQIERETFSAPAPIVPNVNYQPILLITDTHTRTHTHRYTHTYAKTKFNINRLIPDDIKRIIHQKSGVVC